MKQTNMQSYLFFPGVGDQNLKKKQKLKARRSKLFGTAFASRVEFFPLLNNKKTPFPDEF